MKKTKPVEWMDLYGNIVSGINVDMKTIWDQFEWDDTPAVPPEKPKPKTGPVVGSTGVTWIGAAHA